MDQTENFLIALGNFLQFDIFTLDLIGTAVFAYGGAVVAFRHRFNLLGAMVVALATATGGGTVRSLLVGAPSVFWIKHYEYLVVIAVSVVLAMLPRPFHIGIRTLPFHIVDAFSTAIFISLGAAMYNEYVFTIPAAIAMSALTGMGGGLIRDMLVRRSPQALIDPAYPFVVLGGSSGALHAMLTGYPIWLGAVVGVFTVEIIRGFLHVSGIAKHAIGLAGTAALDTGGQQGEQEEHSSTGFPYSLVTLVFVAALIGIVSFSQLNGLPDRRIIETIEIPVSVARSKERYSGLIISAPPVRAVASVSIPVPPRPSLGNNDITQAKAEFYKLVKAIELRNPRAVDALTTGSTDKQKLFSGLFDRYIKFDLSVSDYQINERTVSAMLTLNAMLLPDGNLAMPADSYRNIPVSIEQQGGNWSRIQW